MQVLVAASAPIGLAFGKSVIAMSHAILPIAPIAFIISAKPTTSATLAMAATILAHKICPTYNEPIVGLAIYASVALSYGRSEIAPAKAGLQKQTARVLEGDGPIVKGSHCPTCGFFVRSPVRLTAIASTSGIP